MCGQFSIPTERELVAVARAIEYDEPLDVAIINTQEAFDMQIKAFPGKEVPIYLTSAEKPRPLRIKYLTWGFPFKNQEHGGFNARVETAACLPIWRDSFENRHCVIPATAFIESSQTEMTVSERTGKPIKQKYRFENADGGLVLLAGIWKPDCFSMLTTSAGQEVEEVKDRMPVVLDLAGARSWLFDGVLEDATPVPLISEKV